MSTGHDVTMDVVEAAAFLKMSPAVLRQKAKLGVVKGAKPGKCWVFLQSELVAYLESLYSIREQKPQGGWKEVSSCHSISAGMPGGSDSQPPGGQQVRRSSQTANKKQAQEFHDELKVQYWRVERLGEKPKRRWEDAVERWLLEKEGEKVTLDQDKAHFRWLHPILFGYDLDKINRDVLDGITQKRKAEGVSNATVNRLLEVIRGVLRRAEREWELVDKAPYVRLLKEPKKRVRWLTQDEAMILLRELPVHLAEMMRFTLATGLRARNVSRMEWSQVDLNRKCAWIHPDQAKARKAIPVPLNAGAMAVLKRQVGLNSVFVFTYQGKPVTHPNNHAWRKALKRAGIENFRWHDLRHTWASWHIQQATPLYVLQELGGWAGPEMVQRYAHLSAEHLAQYANALPGPKS